MFAAYGTSREFADPRFWDDPRDGMLFLFHLHGFSALAEYAARPRAADGDAFWARVIDSWLTYHDRPSNPAWHPYPTSVRIISWSVALSGIREWPGEFRTKVAEAVLGQARYLRRAIEQDLGGNHVIKNATALAFAGALFPSSRLLRVALRLLKAETARQILSDGGHEERSPSYHREVTGDLSDVLSLLVRSEEEVPDWLHERQKRMESWLSTLAGPNGQLPLLNDSWEGPPVKPRTGEPVTVLPESGYVILRHGTDQLVFDSGPLCPRHLPPHAHADALSFVLWADGRPLIVDLGSFVYTGPDRDAFRGTSAHNTVQVDGRDQCCFWGDFRAGRLPQVDPPRLSGERDVVVVSSCHDGYRRLADPVVHERTVAWWRGKGVVVLDRLRCQQPHRIASRLHLAPSVSLCESKLGPYEVEALGRHGMANQERARFSAFLGDATPTVSLVIERLVSPGEVSGWALLRPGSRVVEVDGESLVLESRSDSMRVPVFVR